MRRLPTFTQTKRLFYRFVASFSQHDVLTLAAALAFYTALSLAPLVLIVISVVGFLGDGAQTNFLNQATAVVGQQAGETLQMIVRNANEHPSKGGLAGVLGILTLIFSASAVFGQLQASLNVIWEAEEKARTAGWSGYLLKRFFSMGMVLALAFLAVVSLVMSTFIAAFSSANSGFYSVVNFFVSLIAFTYIFGLIFKYLPDIEISWRHVFVGGFITALLFTLGRSVIGFYLIQSAIGSAYGAAGSLIVLLAWVYYSAVILFTGAEFTRTAFSRDETVPQINKPIAEALKS